MSTLLFDSPLEYLLRYTVISGIIVAIIGMAICLMAKRITMAVRKQDEISKQDKLYVGLLFTGIALILIGMIIMALPIEATAYRA